MSENTNNSIDALTKQNIAQALWMQEYDETKIDSAILEKIKSAKNSNIQYATRFKKRIMEMMQNQLSFVTSRKDRYKVIMANADSLSPQACYASNLFLGPESVTGYEPISLNPEFSQPSIDAPQLDYQVGWHFFVGNFTDEENNHYSVELMFWQYALLPPKFAKNLGLSDIENQTLEMHLAICDPQSQKQYRATTSVVAGTTGLVSFDAKPYSYKMGKNSIQGQNANGDLFPVTLTARGYDMSDESNVQEIEIDISLDDVKGIFMEGDEGCSPSIDGVGTLYYSSSLLKLQNDSHSTITINGKSIKLKDGSMWYDHQWGTGFMPSGAPRSAVMRAAQNIEKAAPGGWDWFMFQFHSNPAIAGGEEVQITLSALHTNDNIEFYYQTGPTPPGTMTAKCAGKYIGPVASTDVQSPVPTLPVTGQMEVTKWVKVDFSPNSKVYPPTDTWYPAEYSFTLTGDIPAELKTFKVTPLIASGQIGFFGTGLQYTEGGTVITDANGKELGRGFAEGTNWANCNKGIVALAGLPVTPETLGFLTPPSVGYFMKFLSFIEMWLHKKELETIMAESKGM
ncbi:MAG: lipocalin-like domain-containing protein [Bacteroidales bacterium]